MGFDWTAFQTHLNQNIFTNSIQQNEQSLNTYCPIGCQNNNTIITDNGFRVCNECGCILNTIIDNTDHGYVKGSEKQSHAFVGDTIRCQQVDEFCPKSSLSTYVCANKAEEYRIRKLNMWYASEDPIERSLNEDFKKTFELFLQNSYHQSIVTKAKWLYKTFFEYNRATSKQQLTNQSCVRGGNRRGIIGVCIYFSGRLHSVILSMKEIETILEIKSTHIRKARKEFLRVMKEIANDTLTTKEETINPNIKSLMKLLYSNVCVQDYIDIFGEDMELQPFVIERAKVIFENLTNHIKDSKPQSKAALCLYFSIEHYTQLLGLSNTSDHTLNKKLTTGWILKNIFPLIKKHCDTSYATIRILINSTAHVLQQVTAKSMIEWYCHQLNIIKYIPLEKIEIVTTIVSKLIQKHKENNTSVYVVVCVTLLLLLHLFNISHICEKDIYTATKTTFNDVQKSIEYIIPYTQSISDHLQTI